MEVFRPVEEEFEGTERYAIQRRIGRPVTWTALLTGFGDYHLKAVEQNRAARADGADVWPQMAVRPLVFQFSMRSPFNFDPVRVFADLHAGTEHDRKAAYADDAWREKAQAALDRGRIPVQWQKMVIAETDARPDLVGRTVGDVAAERGVRPLDVICEVALADDLNARFKGILANDDADAIAELLGHEELIIGQRDSNKPGSTAPRGPGVFVFDPKPGSRPLSFERHTVDDGGMACEDALAADLDADGRLDLIAGGRATHNVKIYWNRKQ